MMGDMARFTIPGSLPTMNQIIEFAKSHPLAYKTMKQTNTNRVVLNAKKARLPVMGRINIKITWYRENKKTDKDNVTAGIKFILDGLQVAGVIKNDSWKMIGSIEHDFQIDKVNPRIEVELVEAPE